MDLEGAGLEARRRRQSRCSSLSAICARRPNRFGREQAMSPYFDAGRLDRVQPNPAVRNVQRAECAVQQARRLWRSSALMAAAVES